MRNRSTVPAGFQGYKELNVHIGVDAAKKFEKVHDENFYQNFTVLNCPCPCGTTKPLGGF